MPRIARDATLSGIDDDDKGQICEKCARWFYWPLVGGQPTSGDFAGVPLCPDCYIDEEPHDAR